MRESIVPVTSSSPPDRARKIVAKSVYRELRASGYDHGAVVAIASELLALVTEELQRDDTGKSAA